MKIIEQWEIDLPEWSLCYIVNGDASGIEERDEKQVDRFMARVNARAVELGAIACVDPLADQEAKFNSCPEFGLACNTLLTFVSFLKQEQTK